MEARGGAADEAERDGDADDDRRHDSHVGYGATRGAVARRLCGGAADIRATVLASRRSGIEVV
jgi:hypothetical protein